MSECNEDLRSKGRVYPRTCALCGLGPCRNLGRPKPPTGGSAVQPAPLTRVELANARATAMALAIQLLGPMTSHEQSTDEAFEFLNKVADRMLAYTLDRK